VVVVRKCTVGYVLWIDRGRDGTQVSFTCSGKTQLEYRWGRKASACWRPFLGARLLTRGGSPLVEGGFPFSVETDEFEEEVQGGGNAKRLGKFQVAAAPESSKP
jgi:hypothetical protein